MKVLVSYMLRANSMEIVHGHSEEEIANNYDSLVNSKANKWETYL